MKRQLTNCLSEPRTVYQRDVLAYLIAFTEANGYQPSIRDIGLHFNGNTNTTGIFSTLRRLADQGFVRLREDDGRARTRAIKILLNPDGTPFRGFQQRRP